MMRKQLFCFVLMIILNATGCSGTDSVATRKQAEVEGVRAGQVVRCTGNPNSDPMSLTFEERWSIIRQHSKEVEFPGGIWFIEYDKAGTRAPVEEILPGKALEVAASAYAMCYLDFDVSLGDIVDNGFWPFYGILDGYDPDYRLYDFGISRWIARGENFSPVFKHEIGTDEWRIEVKRIILREFYESYYYAPELTEMRSAMVTEIIPEFWYNNIHNRPMISGTAAGDITTQNLEFYHRNYHHPDFWYEFDVLEIVPPGDSGTDGFQAADKDVTAKETSSSLNCCLFKYEVSPMNNGQECEVNWCCPCSLNPDGTWKYDDCCEIKFEFVGSGYYAEWVLDKCISCDYIPDPNGQEIVIHNGNRAPDTVWVALTHLVELDVKCNSPVCIESTEGTLCGQERSNFIQSIRSGSQHATMPGSVCHCGSSGSRMAGSCCKPAS